MPGVQGWGGTVTCYSEGLQSSWFKPQYVENTLDTVCIFNNYCAMSGTNFGKNQKSSP